MRKFGLVGKSLNHSFSKSFFEEKFLRENIDASFTNFELIDIQQIKSVFEVESLSGLSVTIPYKEEIIPFLDNLTDDAKEIGAINCVSFNSGKTTGHNTDAFGFHQMIKPFLTNKHERALILGTGGASKAVAFVLKNIGVDVLWITRTPNLPKQFSYSDINEHMLKACKLVINCTPIGTFPNVSDVLPLPFQYVDSDHLFVDLIYNPEETMFLNEARKQGAVGLNGLSMLKEQATKAWEIWNH